MGIAEANRTVFTKKYATFSGRASASEFWWPGLTFLLVLLGLGVVSSIVDPSSAYGETSFLGNLISMLILVVFVAGAIPLIAVTARRLHDTGKSGWLYLLTFIPLIGGLILLVLILMGPTPGPNQYGPGPGLS